MAKKAKAAKKSTAKSIRDRVIEQRKVLAEELLANPANWRKHPDQQRAAFRGLLKEIGFAGAALAYYSERAGGALTLIDGHLRREELGPRFELACTITDLTDAEADKLLAAYDPVGAMAETDRTTFDALMKRAAWDDAEVNAMLTSIAEEHGIVADEVSLPYFEPPTRHSVSVPYDDADIPTLCEFLGVDRLPTHGLGKAISERIKGHSAKADR